MTYAVVYSSRTGNTKVLAEKIQGILGGEACVYFGGVPEDVPEADLIFAGFWTDKGTCSEEMQSFLGKLKGKNLFLFGTAGFGGAEAYFRQILNRVSGSVPESSTIKGTFMCQGKMQESVKLRYKTMQEKNPQDGKIEAMLENFENALQHPDSTDLENLEGEIKRIWRA